VEEERRDLDNMYSDIPLEGKAPVRMPRDLPSLPKHQIGTLPQLIAGWGSTSKAATAREKTRRGQHAPCPSPHHDKAARLNRGGHLPVRDTPERVLPLRHWSRRTDLTRR